ncbi:hypothetical protein FDECE_17298 [Fusarium decemcellulare]|nr:hypothetical protein FDECE_17298 [Fusarium decemcellulare]
MPLSPTDLHDQDQATTQPPPGLDHQRPSSAEASTRAFGETELNTTQSKTAEKPSSIESNQHESLAFNSDLSRYQSTDFAELDDDPFFGADFNAELGSPAFLDEHTSPHWHGLEQDAESHSNLLVPEQAAPMAANPQVTASPPVTVSMWSNEAPLQTMEGPFEYNPSTARGGFQPADKLPSATEHAGLVPENRALDGSPSINELAAGRDGDGRKGMVQIWLNDEMNDMSIKPGEKSEQSTNLRDPPDLPEDQNPFDYKTKNRDISGRSYYDTEDEMSKQDMNLIRSNRNWSDASVFHFANREQPKTSQGSRARSTFPAHIRGSKNMASQHSIGTDAMILGDSNDCFNDVSLSREDQRNKLGGLLGGLRGWARWPKTSQSNMRTHSIVEDGEISQTEYHEFLPFELPLPQIDLSSSDPRALFKKPVDVVNPPKSTPRPISSSDQPESPEGESKMVEPEYDISSTRGFFSTIEDCWKRAIEHIVGCRLSWWPLSEPEDELQPGYTRVYSMLFDMPSRKKQRFYDDIPTPLAETMFPKLADARRSTQRSGWTASGPKAVSLSGETLMHLLHRQGDGDASQRQSNRSNKRQRGKTRDTEGVGRRLQEAGVQSLQERDNQTDVKSQQIIFISSDITSNESVASTVEVGENDATTVRNLRAAFRRLPSRGWKRATGVKFYRFQSFHFKPSLKRRYVVVDKDKERYPEEADPEYVSYKYDPRPWEDGKTCPCLSGEAWFFFKNPDECCNSNQLNRALPVRLKDTNDSRITAWGIHIEQRHSAWVIFIPAIALALITLAATFWFIPQWLKDHPGDLQNATVPAVIAFGVMQLFIQLLVSLLIFRWSV